MIKWKYFFGGGIIGQQHHFYKSEINGVRVEKRVSPRGTVYSIGNIDEAKKRFKTESDLLQDLKQQKNV